MKNIILGLISVGILVTISGCSDFLDESPKSSMTSGQYFAIPDHARATVNALYRSGAPSFNSGGIYSGTHLMDGGYISGFFDNEFKGQEKICQFAQTLQHDGVNISDYIDPIWDGCYSAIARANTALKFISTTPGIADDEVVSLEAQAKFFRAYNYFFLVKFFGDVPLILEPYESLENLYVARTSTADVYAQIIADLKAATEGLNNEAFTKNGFRVTKWSAFTVLADVYLNMSGFPLQANHYADAATAARNVINSGKQGLLTNGPTPEESAYNQIRTIDDSYEYIYSYEYEISISNNGYRPAYSFPSDLASLGIFKYSITNNVYRPLEQILNAYDPTQDLRIQEKQFMHSNLTYIKNDMSQTITFPVSPYIWFDSDALFNTGRSGKDVAIYRYPEVLLIAAEAIALTEGVTPEAVSYLAQVRARAYTQTTQAAIESELSSLSKDAFVQQIWTERIREFILENKIWQDIQRTRMYPSTSSANKGVITFIPVVGATNPWGATYQESDLLWPLSQNEIQRNPSLVQNPGFTK